MPPVLLALTAAIELAIEVVVLADQSNLGLRGSVPDRLLVEQGI